MRSVVKLPAASRYICLSLSSRTICTAGKLHLTPRKPIGLPTCHTANKYVCGGKLNYLQPQASNVNRMWGQNTCGMLMNFSAFLFKLTGAVFTVYGFKKKRNC